MVMHLGSSKELGLAHHTTAPQLSKHLFIVQVDRECCYQPSLAGPDFQSPQQNWVTSVHAAKNF